MLEACKSAVNAVLNTDGAARCFLLVLRARGRCLLKKLSDIKSAPKI